MDILGSVVGAVATGGVSGILGMVGGITNRVIDFKVAKSNNEVKKYQIDTDLEEAKLEAEMNTNLARMETETAREQAVLASQTAMDAAASEDFQAAHASDKATYSRKGGPFLLTLVDFMRGTARVMGLYFLCYLTWDISSDIDFQAAFALMDKEQVFDIVVMVIQFIMGLTGMAFGFYYGNRAPNPSRQK